MDMLLGSRFGADHELARRAALALRLHSVPAVNSKPLPSQIRSACHWKLLCIAMSPVCHATCKEDC